VNPKSLGSLSHGQNARTVSPTARPDTIAASPVKKLLLSPASQALPISWQFTTWPWALKLSRRARDLSAGSLGAAIKVYLNSGDFLALAAATQTDHRRILERLAAGPRGPLPFARMESRDVEQLLAEKSASPHVAKAHLKAIRAVKVAVKLAMISKDPTAGVKVHAPTSETGFRMWEEDEIAQFEAHWLIGSRERLAFALALFTGQRRGDVIRMGRQHVRGGVMTVRQGKTGAVVVIPVHPMLEAILAAAKGRQLTFLTTESGEPFSPNYFTNVFGHSVRAAGLPLGLSAHGLRKAMCRRLAEAGCTVHEIQAISGHKSLKEVERYTKGVEQQRLAVTAMGRVCKPSSHDLQTDTQAIENKEEGIADVSLVWTRTSRTSPSASTARHR
jgi:integrase